MPTNAAAAQDAGVQVDTEQILCGAAAPGRAEHCQMIPQQTKTPVYYETESRCLETLRHLVTLSRLVSQQTKVLMCRLTD